MTERAQQAQQNFPEERRWGAAVRMLPDFLIYNFGIRQAIEVIMTVVGFVLLIACANVAGLLLTRAVGRQKELAIRMSLGASRARVIRQLFTEGVLLALTGGATGLFLSYFGIRVVRAGLNFNSAISDVPIALDKNVLLFAAAVSILSAILSSVAPALKVSRSAVNADLKNESRGATSGREHRRMRSVLVGGEIAVSLLLLIGSSLLIRSVYLLDHLELGFHQDHLLTAAMVLDKARYADPTKQNQFVRDAVAQLGADSRRSKRIGRLRPSCLRIRQRRDSHQGPGRSALQRTILGPRRGRPAQLLRCDRRAAAAGPLIFGKR